MLDPRMVRKTFGMPKQVAQLMIMLLERPYVTGEQIVTEGLSNDPAALVHRLRKHLLPYTLEVKSRRDVGYWFEPLDQVLAIGAIDGTKELPVRQAGNSSAEALLTRG